MKFDSNQAWQQASAAIAGNREVLLALAGVFFLLPTLVVALLFPQPELAPGMSNEASMKAMSDYYASAMPFMIPAAIVQMAGTLAMLTLFTDRSRPTVGEAIRTGFAAIVPYFLAQMLFALAIGLGGGLLIGIAGATGAAALVAIAVMGVVALVIYGLVRTALVAPVISVEGERNPVAALRRSWALTRGNTARILLFFALVAIAFLIVTIIAMALAGLVLALVAGPEGVRVGGAVISSAVGAVMTLYFVAMIAAVHRQLAGPSREASSEPFE